MVRISDILKHKGQIPEPEPEKEEKAPKEEPIEYTEKIETKPPEGIHIAKAITQEEAQIESKAQVASAMRQLQLDPEESRRIYNHSLEVIKYILNNVTSQRILIDLSETREIIKLIVDRIVLGDKELISLVTNYSQDNYLYAHSVNVCIISADVGLGLGYNKSKLNILGLGAFLHDLGMTKVIDIAKQPGKLNPKEYTEIKNHPVYGSDILKVIKDVEEEVVYIVKQHHERLNAKGYTEGLEDGEINEYAQIVSVVDAYEALTHPRSYREAFSPHEAIRELSEIVSSGIFEMHIVKMLINRVGLYPVGSWIELNSGEIGKVIASNDDLPLRPKVNIIFGSDRERLSKLKSIDLSRHTNVYIKQSVNPQKLNLKLE